MHRLVPAFLPVLIVGSAIAADRTVDVRFEVGAQLVTGSDGAATPAASFLSRRLEVGRGLRIVQRTVPEGMSPLEAAIRAMIDGPTPEEAAVGLYSHLPPGTTLLNLEITADTVSIDLSKEALQGFDDHVLESLFDQFKATIGDFPEILSIRLLCEGRLLSDYLAPPPPIKPASPDQLAKLAGMTVQPSGPSLLALNALAGRKVTIGPSHGRFWNGSGWFWQRSDPCGLGESVLEDTNSIRLMQFLFQYLSQDGATVTVPRDLTESDCCHPSENQAWWRMASYAWLRNAGLPCSVYGSSSGICSSDVGGVTRVNDDIRARPLFADYVGADIYIAHHTNAGGSGTARGTETFRDTAMQYPAHEANSLTLANSVQNNIISAIRDMYDSCWVSRGVKDSNGGFGEIRLPNRPAILVELAFHDGCNPSSVGCGNKDTDALRSNYFRSVSQWGIYKGVCDYFGVTPGWDKYSDEYVSDTIPTNMIAGQTYNVSVTFRNRGVLWSNAYNFRLGAVGDSDPFTAFNRVNISGEVRPGQTYTFNFSMTAPGGGNYISDWRMVRDGVAWFGATLTKNITVIATGPDNGPPSDPANLTAFASNSTTVQLNWTASIDDVGVVAYDVRRNGNVIGAAFTNSYTDSSAAPNTGYTYEVRARDAVPNYSNWSNSAGVTTPGSAPGDYIVESRSGGQNYAKYSEIGGFADTTAKSTAAGCTAGIGGRYGSANQPVAGVKRAQFRYNVPVSGVYEAWVTTGNQTNRNANVQTIISHALGDSVTSFDQPANTNVWKSLGQFNFNAGTNTGLIELNNNNGNAAGSNVNVDSTRWTFVSYLPVPGAPSSGGNPTICAGTTTAISASVPSGQTVDWFTGSCGGTLLQAGATSINVTPGATTSYYARARSTGTGIYGNACTTVTVNVTAAPTVSAPSPANPARCEGSSVTFNVTAGGTGPFTYQWKRDTTPVGTNNSSLTINALTSADAGVYTCTVSGPGCPPIASSGSTLTVVGPCDDGNACTADSCDTSTNACVFVPIDISDEDPCTTDACDPQSGQVTHEPVVCDDNDPCTADACDGQTGQCAFAPIDTDGDTVADCQDNCPTIANDQADFDADLIGDVCDPCPYYPITCPTRSVVAWRSVRTHSGVGPLAIALNATATGNGLSGPGVESRQGGVQSIEVQFDGPVTLINPAAATAAGHITAAGVMGAPSAYAITSVTAVAPDTLAIQFVPGLPDQGCYQLALGASLIAESLTGDPDVWVRGLFGDTTGNGDVVLGDTLATKARVAAGTLATAAPQHDVNVNGAINLGDVLAVKSRVSSPTRSALCP